MKIITLRRFVPENTIITPGVLLEDKMPFAVTLELPWKNNANFISCIATGEKICKRYSSAKYPDTWQITGCDGRDLVLLHWGNFLKDTHGCVLVGEKFSDINNDGIMDIAESKNLLNEGFHELMKRTEGLDEFKLIIEQSYEWII